MIKTFRKGSGEKLAANFNSNEFDCKGVGCCNSTKVDTALVSLLQKLREHFGKSVRINSGYRCEKHNAAVGGTAGSRHKNGQAADIVVSGVATNEVAAYLQSIGAKGIIRYVTKKFVHVDTREKNYFSEVTNGVSKKVSSFGGVVCPYPVPKTNIRRGSKGDDVRYVQFMLIRHGFSGVGSIDGIAGSKTVNAIKSFQKSRSLKVDGIAGVKTIAELCK